MLVGAEMRVGVKSCRRFFFFYTGGDDGKSFVFLIFWAEDYYGGRGVKKIL